MALSLTNVKKVTENVCIIHLAKNKIRLVQTESIKCAYNKRNVTHSNPSLLPSVQVKMKLRL